MSGLTAALSLRLPTTTDLISVEDDLNANSQKLDAVAGRGIPVVRTLVDASPIATNVAVGKRFRVALAADRTLAAPTGATDGQEVVWEATAVTSNRMLTLSSGVGGFEFGTDLTALTPIIAGTTDYIGCVFNAPRNKWRVLSYMKGFIAA